MCMILLGIEQILLVVEVVAWSVPVRELGSREFLYETFILYWCIPIVAFVCVSTQINNSQ